MGAHESPLMPADPVARCSSSNFPLRVKQYATAIIGVGRGGEGKAGIHSIGYAHANAYQNNARTRLVGACDLNVENLQAFAAAYSIPGYANLSEMLEAARPDIVRICTYAGTHRSLVEQCLAGGVKAIWCEKPLCLTWMTALLCCWLPNKRMRR
jgi:predicted dehydrogenase